MKTKFLTLALTALLSTNVFAGGSSGIPSSLYSHQENIFIFNAGNHANPPSCATSGEWAISLSTPTGRSMQATIMLAYALNKSVDVKGAGDCGDWGDRERPAFVHLQ